MVRRLPGPSLFTCRSGPSAGRDVVIFIHGMESHAGWFSRVMAILSEEGIQCLAFDRMGFGQSPGKRGHISSLAACVGEIRAIRQASVESNSTNSLNVHLVGMSWGGLLAAYMAVGEPDLWSSVTLIAPAIFTTKMPSPSHLAKACLTPWTKVDLPIDTTDFSLSPQIQTEIAKDPHRVTAVSLATLLHTLRLQLQLRGGWAARLRQKAAQSERLLPMQLLLSPRDSLIDSKRTSNWARLLGIEVSWAHNAAHSLVLDCPEWVADQLSAFMARVSHGPSTTTDLARRRQSPRTTRAS